MTLKFYIINIYAIWYSKSRFFFFFFKSWFKTLKNIPITILNDQKFIITWISCVIFRACLIATVQSSGTSQSIIKLVSTNLIASGRISEGVQLLCLIEKASDGCRYLQGAARWDESVWLAKVIQFWTEYPILIDI